MTIGQPLSSYPRDAIKRELAAVELDETLARSPVMRRLLRYLIDESLAGRGAKLKSYTVAVEGLGRSENFDTHTDSYPRVQAGRLRRLLELHYLRHPQSADGIRLKIASVGYEIVVAEALHSASGETGADSDLPANAPTTELVHVPTQPVAATGPNALAPKSKGSLPVTGAISAFVAVVAAPILFVIVPMIRTTPVDTGDHPPVLSVVVSGGSSSQEREAVRGWLLGSLTPSWLFRLADVDDTAQPPAMTASARQRAYRLKVNIAGPQPSNYQFVLTDSQTSEVLWSANVRSPSPLTRERTVLDPLITRLSSPSGVIANHQKAVLNDSPAGIYHCALMVEDYISVPTAAARPTVVSCIDAGLKRQPDNIQLLTTKAVLGFNRNDPLSDLSPAGFARTYSLVQRAAERDPNDPRTAMIQARYYFLAGDCPRGIARAEDAVSGWPHSARFWGVSGFYLFECGDPRGPDFVRNAVRLEGRSMNMYESVLVFDALDRGDIAAANAAATQMNAADRRVDMFRTLNLAVLHAANGRQAPAQRYWREFAAAVGVDPSQREAVLDAYRTGTRQRRIAERYLSRVL